MVEKTLERLQALRRTMTDYATAPPEIDWVVQDTIERGAVVVIYGDSGIGKTWLALHLVGCIASGSAWFGYEVHGKHNVAWLDGENGEDSMHRRAHAVMHADENVNFYSLPNITCSEEGLAVMGAFVESTGTEVLVLDPLMYFTDGDENTIADMRSQLYGLVNIAKSTGCVVIMVHHENRSGTYRGTSAIKDSSTLMLHMQEETPIEGFRNATKIIPVKRRESTFNKTTVAWDIQEGRFVAYRIEEARDVYAGVMVDAVKELIHRNATLPTTTELRDAKDIHGLSRDHATEALARAVEDGLVKVKVGNHNRQTVEIIQW